MGGPWAWAGRAHIAPIALMLHVDEQVNEWRRGRSTEQEQVRYRRADFAGHDVPRRDARPPPKASSFRTDSIPETDASTIRG